MWLLDIAKNGQIAYAMLLCLVIDVLSLCKMLSTVVVSKQVMTLASVKM